MPQYVLDGEVDEGEDIFADADDPALGLPLKGDDPYKVVRAEVDRYCKGLRRLNEMDPSEVFQKLSSISARLSEIRIRLLRVEGRKPAALRTKEIDPLLEEVDRQFKFHSRLQATREMDASLIRGQV